jgi:MFS family permease
METEKKATNEITWTWADQISTYRFWGIFLFFIFMLIPNGILNYSFSIFREQNNLSSSELGTLVGVKNFAALGGFWLAWFMVRMRHHYMLFGYAAILIIGLLFILMFHSMVPMVIGFFLVGICFGGISLAMPSIIAGGRGGSEMFVISFGLLSFFEISYWISFSAAFGGLLSAGSSPNSFLIIALVSAVIGTILLIPVKATLFNYNPPKREFSLEPTERDPAAVALLCLIPIYNIYYILHLAYRLHGEVNTIKPTQNILSPRAAVWSVLFLSVLSPVIVSSLNRILISKLAEDGKTSYYKNWAVILWSFLFVPISYALIQSNMNQIIAQKES